jgi:undecaprenyl-diphosphatase
LRGNLALSRALWVGRRRDLRFQVLPFSGAGLLNGVALAATAVLISLFGFDPLLVAWQTTLPDGVVAFFRTITRLGRSEWILLCSGVFVVLMLALDAMALPARLRVRRAVRTLAAFYVFAAVASAQIIANVAKYTVGRARPMHEVENAGVDFWEGEASFPSGHATTAMAASLALALLFPRFRYLFLCLGFWIAASRLFAGLHYPSDVLAGCLLGSLAAWLIARALARRRLIFGFDAEGGLVRRRGASGRLI